MTTIYLIRHAKYHNPHGTLGGRLPYSLSPEGKQEAKKLQAYFRDKSIDTIFSSAVQRCKETSHIISDNQIHVEFDHRLLETHSAYQGYWEEDWTHFFSHVHELGGETYQDIQNRVVDFWSTTEFEDGRNYIICSHGDPLFFLYLHLNNEPLPEMGDPAEYLGEGGYPEKGSIRPIKIKQDSVEIGELILQAGLFQE